MVIDRDSNPKKHILPCAFYHLIRGRYKFGRYKMASGIKRSREELEEIINGMGYKLLDEYINENNHRRIVVQSPEGYRWDGELGSLLKAKRGINFFDTRNPFTLENIPLWLKLNHSEFELCEENVYEDSKKNLKFFHSISKCKEEFWMSWHNISQRQGCPVCHGKQVGKKTSLAYLRSDIAEEWHSDNEKSPEEVTVSSGYKAYWVCRNCGYGKDKEWYSKVFHRTGGEGCPACARKVVTDINRLSIVRSDISCEWDHDKNEDTPDDVSYGCNEKRWWTCPKGHSSYYSSINGRTTNGKGCPQCSNSKGENIICHWLQENESLLLNIGVIGVTPQKRFTDCRNKKPLPFDFGLEFQDNSWFLIEYHGPQHYKPVDFGGRGVEWTKIEFEENRKKDEIKEKYCRENNIPLLIIPYFKLDVIEDILRDELGR